MELLNSILYDTVYHSAPIILCVIGGIFAYKTFMPRILGTTINETYMGHDWVFSCLP